MNSHLTALPTDGEVRIAGGIGTGGGVMPALDLPSGLSGPGASFMSGPQGREKIGIASFNPVQVGWGSGFGGAIGATFGNIAHKDRTTAAAIASELSVSAGTMKTVLEVLTNNTLGPSGLTCSSKIDNEAIGVTADEAREINRQCEKVWNNWASNPAFCDASARFDFHALAASAFQNFLVTGEILAFADSSRDRGVPFVTRCSLQDNRIISLESKKSGSSNVFLGVQFSAKGRFEGLWVRTYPLGSMIDSGQLRFIAASTSWGRPRVCHLFQQIAPFQVRGLSPLTNSIAGIASRELLQEITLSTHVAQLNYALVVESAAPARIALSGLEAPGMDESAFGSDGGAGAIAGAMTTLRASWYGAGPGSDGVNPKLSATGANALHLAPGDALRVVEAARIDNNYAELNQALLRDVARSAGAASSEIHGDYSKVNYSASRAESNQPGLTALKRRREVAERFYATFYRCVIEEAIATGMISLPKSAISFWDDPTAYCKASWLGRGNFEADRLKATNATILRLSNGIDTLSETLAMEGKDFDSHLQALVRERAAFQEAGVPLEFVTSSQRKIVEAEDDGGSGEGDGKGGKKKVQADD